MTAGSPTTETGSPSGRSDQAGVRRANLGLVARALAVEPQTRARLAATTGLTKASVSSLVTELAARGLLRSHGPTREGSVGRPGSPIELVGGRVLGFGLEVNVDYLAVTVLDLLGRPVVEDRMSYAVAEQSPEDTLDALISRAEAVADEALNSSGVVLAGVGLAVPGLMDTGAGVVRVAPNLGWPETPVRDLLVERLRRTTPKVLVDNEANLATLAEYAVGETSGARELVYLTGGVGIGGGVVAQGRLLRGASGYAGEVGHLTLDPVGTWCGCGRRGCWETVGGLGALLDAAADAADPVRDPGRDLDERMGLVLERVRTGDRRTTEAVEQVGRALGLGASMLVNVVNPELLVLGGYFAHLGELLLPLVRSGLSEHVVAPDSGGCRVELSRLGLTAASIGAAHAVCEPILTDPTLVPYLEHERVGVPQTTTSMEGSVR